MWKITFRPVIAINKTCSLTSRSRLESYKRLVSFSSRLVKPTTRSRLGRWATRSRLGLELVRLVPIPGISVGFQYQCNQLPGIPRLHNNLFSAEWDSAHSLTLQRHQQWQNYRNGTVVTRATSNKEKSSATANLSHVVFEAAKHHEIAVEIHSASHRVHHWLWLLMDLFCHEWTETAYSHQACTRKHSKLCSGNTEQHRSTILLWSYTKSHHTTDAAHYFMPAALFKLHRMLTVITTKEKKNNDYKVATFIYFVNFRKTANLTRCSAIAEIPRCRVH